MEILKLKKIFFLIIIFISINSQTLADAKLFISKLTSDASKILAKHDENYMPPEVKEALGDK